MEMQTFINDLASYQTLSNSTNFYSSRAAQTSVQRNNLELYLTKMKCLNPTVLLIGEAPGHRGCRLSGVPFTSERIIEKGNSLFDKSFQLLNDTKRTGEATSTIVWGELGNLSALPLLWNIFPFHPHKPENKFSNRAPVKEELESGLDILQQFLKLFDVNTIIAVGSKSSSQLEKLDKKYKLKNIIHPSYGRKNEFCMGLKYAMQDTNKLQP